MITSRRKILLVSCRKAAISKAGNNLYAVDKVGMHVKVPFSPNAVSQVGVSPDVQTVLSELLYARVIALDLYQSPLKIVKLAKCLNST